jgi:hypothetical protein
MIITNQTLDDVKDLELAKQVGELLYEFYPNWMWAVEIQDHGPFIRLLNAPVQGWGYYVNPKDLLTPSTLRKNILHAGGEMLERCGCTRNAKSEDGFHKRIINMEGAGEGQYTIPKSMRGQ